MKHIENESQNLLYDVDFPQIFYLSQEINVMLYVLLFDSGNPKMWRFKQSWIGKNTLQKVEKSLDLWRRGVKKVFLKIIFENKFNNRFVINKTLLNMNKFFFINLTFQLSSLVR